MSSADFDALNDALISGNHDTINFLLLKKIKLSKESLLLKCLHRRNHSILELLLQRGANVNHTDNNGKSILELAIEYSFPEFVKTLINHGASLDVRTKISIDKYNTDYSLLHKAVNVGNIEIIELLLKNGANPNQKSKTGIHPLSCRCQNDCYYYLMHFDSNYAFRKTLSVLDVAILCNPKQGDKIVDLLCKNGAIVELQTDYYLPLHLAVLEATNTSKIDKLLEYGANINSLCENFGYTPLAHAVLKEDEKIVSHLLKKGAIFFKYSINSVLQQLVLHASPKMEKFLALLIDSGADINSKNEMGKTALHVAISDFRSKNYLKILTDFGSDVNAQDKEGNTPLHWAIKMGNDVALQVLLEYDADVSVLKKSEEYPLVSAVRKINMFNLITKFMSHDVSSELTVRFFAAEMNVFSLIQIIIVKEVTGKFVDDKLLSFVKKNLDYFHRTFLKELEGMRVQAVKAKVSYFDLLTKSAKEVEPYISQKMIENLMTSEIDNKFPFYAQMMKMRISKIKERLILVEHSGRFLKTVFRLERSPPNIICEMICSYLSSFDLINLWRVCKRPEEYLTTLLDRPV